ncbi:hypothetical protein A5881_003812 [Enterococcus termitis]|nr:hypothetical protein A5881_000181 [Enterococcus termitis]
MMVSAKRLGMNTMFLFIVGWLILGFSMQTSAVETGSNATETQELSSVQNNEPQTESSSVEPIQATDSSAEEISTEKQLDQQVVVKATKEYASELLTDVRLSDIANNPIHRVKNSDKFKVNYSFYLPDEAQAGDELIVELPLILQMVNYSDFPILNENGEKIGVAKIDRTTNKVTVTFNQYVTDHNSINGQFFFWVKLVNDQIVEGVNPIPLPVNGATSNLDLTITKTSGVSTGLTNPTTIFKSGKFDSVDPKKINWTITINNSAQNLLMPIIYDQLGAGQELLSDTFSVNYRDTDKKSLKKYVLPSKIPGDLKKVELAPSGFTLFLESLGSYSEDKGYISAVINYSTRVTDPTIKSVNSANTLAEDGTKQSRNASLTNYANGGIGNGDVNQSIDVITDKIDEADSLDLDEFTDSSSQKLLEAKESAQTVVDDENATISDLETATETLVNQLVTSKEIAQPTDIQELETFIEQNDSLKEKDYTPETWTTWINKKTEAVNLIQVVKESPKSISRNEILQMTQDLKSARANLVEAILPSETSESESSSETANTEIITSAQLSGNGSSNVNNAPLKNQQRLLKTGETHSNTFRLMGLLLLFLAAWLVVRKERVEK